MAVYVYEFLYRGRAPGDATPPAWHIALRSATTDDFGRTVLSEPLLLNMTQAAQQEWDLPAIISAINAETLAFAEAETARANAAEQALEDALAQIQPQPPAPTE